MYKKLIIGLLSLLPTTLYAQQHEAHPSVAEAYRSTCGIQNNNRIRGTGVLLDSGYVITAAHVIDLNRNGFLEERERLVDLKFYAPKPLVTQGWVLSIGDPSGKQQMDMAVIIPCIPLYSKVKLVADPQVGTPVFTIGHPLGGPPVITEGRISHPRKEIGRTSTHIYAGNSGGGVFISKTQHCAGIIVRVELDRRFHRSIMVTHLAEYVQAKHIKRAIDFINENGNGPLELLRFMQKMIEQQKQNDRLAEEAEALRKKAIEEAKLKKAMDELKKAMDETKAKEAEKAEETKKAEEARKAKKASGAEKAKKKSKAKQYY